MKELKFSPEEMLAADEQIEQLLAKNAIQKCNHEQGEFISNVFLCPKKDGRYRMILNFKKFNKFIEKVHFKMETIDTILQLITPNCFMMKIDLSNAYLMISVFFEHRKLLKFYWRGQLFMYLVVPFGLSSALHLFTKLLKPIVAHLHNLGFIVTFYLDDSWQKGDNYDKCLLNCETMYNLLQTCGFIPNDKKSVLIPTQKLEILGHIVDSVNMCVSLPCDKTKTVVNLCTELLVNRTCTIHHLAKVIGCLILCTRVCVLGNLYYRSLERTKVNALRVNKGKWDKKVMINEQNIRDLHWWISNLPNAIAPIRRKNLEITVFSDACDYGWGMVVNGITANGHFSLKELPRLTPKRLWPYGTVSNPINKF